VERTTDFERVYRVVRRIPKGRVTTYGAIARRLRLKSPRQVGAALRAIAPGSPLPWHRVVGAGGAIRLTGHGAVTQRLRLEREGVAFRSPGRVDLRRCGWRRRPGLDFVVQSALS